MKFLVLIRNHFCLRFFTFIEWGDIVVSTLTLAPSPMLEGVLGSRRDSLQYTDPQTLLCRIETQ